MADRNERVPVWSLWALIAMGAVQLAAWFTSGGGALGRPALVTGVAGWINLLLLAGLVSRTMRGMRRRISQHETAHRATRDEVSSLQLQNEMLQIIARASDVTVAFQSLAPKITRLVPSDRLGLALLSEDGREFQTITARTPDEDRRARPRPEVVFKVEGTALGHVVRSQEPLLINDTPIRLVSISTSPFYPARAFTRRSWCRSSRRGAPSGRSTSCRAIRVPSPSARSSPFSRSSRSSRSRWPSSSCNSRRAAFVRWK